jgi:hypothetical protein
MEKIGLEISSLGRWWIPPTVFMLITGNRDFLGMPDKELAGFQ